MTMEQQYYMIIKGQQTGPISRSQLSYYGLTSDTPVWRQGLADWVKASSLPELNDLLNPGSYQQPAPPVSEYAQPQFNRPSQQFNQPVQPVGGYNPQPNNPNNGMPIEHTNWLTWAIIASVVSFLFSCIGLIFGIIAITNANKANKYYDMGEKMLGDTANSSARTNTIIAFVLAGVGFIFNIILFFTRFLSNL